MLDGRLDNLGDVGGGRLDDGGLSSVDDGRLDDDDGRLVDVRLGVSID